MRSATSTSAAALASAVLLGACGGSMSGGSFTGTVEVTQAPASCTSCSATETVHFTSGGASPAAVSVPGSGCGCVIFTNDDTSPHQVESNPHPTHTDCPDLNMPSADTLSTGQSYTATMAIAGPRTCGYHDHLHPPAPPGMGGGY